MHNLLQNYDINFKILQRFVILENLMVCNLRIEKDIADIDCSATVLFLTIYNYTLLYCKVL